MPSEFVITELRSRDGVTTGAPGAEPVRFSWTAAGRSAPRGSWEFGIEQKTVREDYPGAASPVEQVLSSNFTEFTLQGVWDDRYNPTSDDTSFATTTWRAFEALVARGSLCRFEHGVVSIVGLIKDAKFNYKRADLIGYQFTVSPHYRAEGALAAQGGGRKKSVAAMRPMTEYRDLVNDYRDATAVVMAGGPFNSMSPELTATTKARVASIDATTTDLVETIRLRISSGTERLDGLRRAAASFAVLKGEVAALVTDLAVARSDLELAYDDAKEILDFDTWSRDLAAYARAMYRLSHEAELELARRVQPKAMAVYEPHAGESLYSISIRFYGRGDLWRVIADRNGLTTFTLQGTEVLIIPERS